jgi:hypothetical protein
MSKKFLLISVLALVVVFVASATPAIQGRFLNISRYSTFTDNPVLITNVDKIPKLSSQPVTGKLNRNQTYFYKHKAGDLTPDANVIQLPAFGIGERNGDTALTGPVPGAARFRNGDTLVITFASVLSHKYPKFRFAADSTIEVNIVGGENLRVHPIYRLGPGTSFIPGDGTGYNINTFKMRASTDSAVVLVVDSTTVRIGDTHYVGANGDSIYFTGVKVIPADTAITGQWNDKNVNRCEVIDSVVILVKRAPLDKYGDGSSYVNAFPGLQPIQYQPPSGAGLTFAPGFLPAPSALWVLPQLRYAYQENAAVKFILAIRPGDAARIRWGAPPLLGSAYSQYLPGQELYFGPQHRWDDKGGGTRGGVDTMVVGGNVGVDTLALVDQYGNLTLFETRKPGYEIKLTALDSCADFKVIDPGPRSLQPPNYFNGFLLNVWHQVKDSCDRNWGMYLLEDWSFTVCGTIYVQAYVEGSSIKKDTTYSTHPLEIPLQSKEQGPLSGKIAGMPLKFLPGKPYEILVSVSGGWGQTLQVTCPPPQVCFSVTVVDSFKNPVLPFNGLEYSMTVYASAYGGTFLKDDAGCGNPAAGRLAPGLPPWRSTNEKTDSIQVLLGRGVCGGCNPAQSQITGRATFTYVMPSIIPPDCKVAFTFQIDSLWAPQTPAHPDPLFTSAPYGPVALKFGFDVTAPYTSVNTVLNMIPGAPVNIVLCPDTVVDYVVKYLDPDNPCVCSPDTVNLVAKLLDCAGNIANASSVSDVSWSAISRTALALSKTGTDWTGSLGTPSLVALTDKCSRPYYGVTVVYTFPKYTAPCSTGRTGPNIVDITATYTGNFAQDKTYLEAWPGPAADADMYIAKIQSQTDPANTWYNGFGKKGGVGDTLVASRGARFDSVTSRILSAALTDACGNAVYSGTISRTRSWWGWSNPKWIPTTWSNTAKFFIYTANPNGGLGKSDGSSFKRLQKSYNGDFVDGSCNVVAVELRTDTVGGGTMKFNNDRTIPQSQKDLDYTDLLKLQNSVTDPNDTRWAYLGGSLDEAKYILEKLRSELHVTVGVQCGASSDWVSRDSLLFRVIPDSIDRVAYINDKNVTIPSLGPKYAPDALEYPDNSDTKTKRTQRQFRLVVDSTNNCAGAIDNLVVRLFDRYGNPIFIEDTSRVFFNKLKALTLRQDAVAGYIGPTGGVFVPSGSITRDDPGANFGDKFLNGGTTNIYTNGTMTVVYQTYFFKSDTTVIQAVAKGSTWAGNTGLTVFIDSGVVRSKFPGALHHFVLLNPNKSEIPYVCARNKWVGDSTMVILEAQDVNNCRLYWYLGKPTVVQLVEQKCGSPNSPFGDRAKVVADTLAYYGLAVADDVIHALTTIGPWQYAWAPDGDGFHLYSGTGFAPPNNGLPDGWGPEGLYKLFPGSQGEFPITPNVPCAYNLQLENSFVNYGWGVFDIYPMAPGMYQVTFTDPDTKVTITTPTFSYRPGNIRFVSIQTRDTVRTHDVPRYPPDVWADYPRDGNRFNYLNNPTEYSRYHRGEALTLVDTVFYDSSFFYLLKNWDIYGNRNVCDSIYITIEPKLGPLYFSSLGGTIANVDFLVKDTVGFHWQPGVGQVNGDTCNGMPIFLCPGRNVNFDPRPDQFMLKYNGQVTVNQGLFIKPYFGTDVAGLISTRDIYVKPAVAPKVPTLTATDLYRIDSTKVPVTDPFFQVPPLVFTWSNGGVLGPGVVNDPKDTVHYYVEFKSDGTKQFKGPYIANTLTLTGDVVAAMFGLGPSTGVYSKNVTWRVVAYAYGTKVMVADTGLVLLGGGIGCSVGQSPTFYYAWSATKSLTLVYNKAPEAFALTSPANNLIQVVDNTYSQPLAWGAATDVNGDVVKYRAYVQVVSTYPTGTGPAASTLFTFDAGTATTVTMNPAAVQALLGGLTGGSDSTTVKWWVVAEDHDVNFVNNPRSDYLTTTASWNLTVTKIGAFGKIVVNPVNYTAPAINTTVGTPVDMVLTAVDNNNDVFHAFNTSGPLTITLLIRNSTANGSPEPLQKLTVYSMKTGSPVALAGSVDVGFTLARTEFVNGVANIRVIDTKAENGVRLVVGTNGTIGTDSSAIMNFKFGALGNFWLAVNPVLSPDTVFVLRPFELIVWARDMYNNMITDEVQAQFTARYPDEFTAGGGALFGGMRLIAGRMVYTLIPTTARNDQSVTVLGFVDPSKRGTTAAFKIVNHAPKAFSLSSPQNGYVIQLDAYSQTFQMAWTKSDDPYKGWSSTPNPPATPVIYPGDVINYTWKIKEEALIAYPADSTGLAPTKTFTAAELVNLVNQLGGSTSTAAATVTWYVNATDGLFTTPSTQQWTLTIRKRGIVSVEDQKLVPTVYSLDQNYPNPFNPTTSIRYQLPKTSTVTLVIYNMLGQPIRTLISGQQQEAGYYNLTWDGTSDFGQVVSSGMYIYRIQAGDFVATKKMALLK